MMVILTKARSLTLSLTLITLTASVGYMAVFWRSKLRHLQYDCFWRYGGPSRCHTTDTCFWYPNKNVFCEIPKVSPFFNMTLFEGGSRCQTKSPHLVALPALPPAVFRQFEPPRYVLPPPLFPPAFGWRVSSCPASNKPARENDDDGDGRQWWRRRRWWWRRRRR